MKDQLSFCWIKLFSLIWSRNKRSHLASVEQNLELIESRCATGEAVPVRDSLATDHVDRSILGRVVKGGDEDPPANRPNGGVEEDDRTEEDTPKVFDQRVRVNMGQKRVGEIEGKGETKAT